MLVQYPNHMWVVGSCTCTSLQFPGAEQQGSPGVSVCLLRAEHSEYEREDVTNETEDAIFGRQFSGCSCASHKCAEVEVILKKQYPSTELLLVSGQSHSEVELCWRRKRWQNQCKSGGLHEEQVIECNRHTCQWTRTHDMPFSCLLIDMGVPHLGATIAQYVMYSMYWNWNI